MEKLPKLPYGQGSFSYHNDLIAFRKRIKLKDGTFKTKTVYAPSTKECMEKMRKLENDLQKSVVAPKEEILCDSMYKWLEEVKKPRLKSQSYTRLKSTIKNQIEKSSIGHYSFVSISSDELQKLINKLNDEKYSHSTIKKTYDCLNDYYKHVSIKYQFQNPMLLVSMPTVSNVKSETKEIVWLERDEIEKFINESAKTWKTGNQKYSGGYLISANMYMGLRGGELLSIQWKDIDFDKNVVYICKTLIEEANPGYDKNDPESKKVRFVVQNTNKTSLNRYVPINSKAKELLLKHKNVSAYTNPDDFVLCTRNRKTSTLKNLNDTIKKIALNCEINKDGISSHAIRHTCASLYFRAGVPIETIAKILGHSVDVCRTTYIHFVEEQLKEAAGKIEIIEF